MGRIIKLLLISFISANIVFAVIDDKDKYGKEISLKEKTKISDILSNLGLDRKEISTESRSEVQS